MKSVAMLVELVNLWHEYQKQQDTPSIVEFCRNYLGKSEKTGQMEEAKLPPYSVVNKIGTLFGRLGRFAQIYSKKALGPSQLYNTVDFNYLKILGNQEELKKSELISMVVTDFTTGIEVIKRLIKNELVEELPDLEDKRSKRIKITEKGLITLEQGRIQMRSLSELFFDRLNEEEINQLYKILNKLNHRHTSLYKEYKNEDFSTIMTDFHKRKTLMNQQ